MARPVVNLREQATSLEAALVVCMATPNKDAVHKLRTSARRIEAQIELLKMLAKMPPFRTEARKFLRVVTPIRKLAGEVRDLDVLHGLIRKMLSVEAKQRVRLDDYFETRRKRNADKLQRLVEKSIAKLSLATEELFKALKPAQKRVIPVRDLLPLSQNWFARKTSKLSARREGDLHTMRKAAKGSRYIAELAPDSKQAREVALHYNHLQSTGGLWHDYLLLERFARKRLGKKSELTKLAQERSRDGYRRFVARVAA